MTTRRFVERLRDGILSMGIAAAIGAQTSLNPAFQMDQLPMSDYIALTAAVTLLAGFGTVQSIRALAVLWQMRHTDPSTGGETA